MKLRYPIIHATMATLFGIPAGAAVLASYRFDETGGSLLDETAQNPAGDLIAGGSAAYGTAGVPNGTYGAIVVTEAVGSSIGFGPSVTDTQFIVGSDNNNPVMNLAPGASFTAMGWIQPATPTLTTSFTYRMISTGTAASAGRGWGLGLRYTISGATTTPVVRFTAYGIADKDSTGVSITDGQWYHLAATYANGVTNLYLNGTFVSTSGNVLPFGDEPTDARLIFGGRQGGSNGEQASGLLDGIRIYDSVLSPAEIIAAAAASVSMVPEPTILGLGLMACPLLLRRRRQDV